MAENVLSINVKKPRQSNLEWLRIVSMIFIIASHLGVHGVYPEGIPAFSTIIKIVCSTGGKLGVNCFVLISGYFLLNSRFHWRKVVKLVIQVWFYSVSLYLLLSLSYGFFDIKGLARVAFPLYWKEYWFMTAYMMAYLVSPALAILLRNCSPRQHALLVIVMFLILSPINLIRNEILNYETGWFIFLMALGAYIARYPKVTSWVKPWMALIVWFVFLVGIVAADYWGHEVLYMMQHPVCLIWSIILFITFANAKIPNSKIVNRIASAMLGIYLIHDNNYVRPRLWNDWFFVGSHAQSNTFIVFTIVAIIIVWVTCTFAEIIRQIVFDYAAKGIRALCSKVNEKRSLKSTDVGNNR